MIEMQFSSDVNPMKNKNMHELCLFVLEKGLREPTGMKTQENRVTYYDDYLPPQNYISKKNHPPSRFRKRLRLFSRKKRKKPNDLSREHSNDSLQVTSNELITHPSRNSKEKENCSSRETSSGLYIYIYIYIHIYISNLRCTFDTCCEICHAREGTR